MKYRSVLLISQSVWKLFTEMLCMINTKGVVSSFDSISEWYFVLMTTLHYIKRFSKTKASDYTFLTGNTHLKFVYRGVNGRSLNRRSEESLWVLSEMSQICDVKYCKFTNYTTVHLCMSHYKREACFYLKIRQMKINNCVETTVSPIGTFCMMCWATIWTTWP